LGEIKEGKMVLNEFGKIVDREILNTPNIRNNIGIDIYQIMPNHVHVILIIQSEGRGVMHYAPTNKLKSPSQTLGAVIRGIKSAITTNIKRMINNQNIIIWQRNYYEHIIRNNHELAILREYIENNPAQWEIDEENPKNLFANKSFFSK